MIAGALCAVLTGMTAAPAAVEAKTLIFGVPGIPPIFASMIAIVADKQGFFKKHGAEVEVKFLESGTAASRALVSGDIDLALSPSPLVTSQISNAAVDVVGIYGMPVPDFLIASVDPKKTSCKDVAGQPVGVDAVGGARSVALKAMIEPCGLKIEDVQQITLPSSSTTAAMIAGRIAFGVLHIDEIPVVEAQGKPVAILSTIAKANPNNHFALFVARRDRLKENRDAYVRLMAGIVDAARFIQDPKNADRFAELADATGRTRDEAKAALQSYVEMGYWPAADDGLDRAKLDAVIATQVKVGAIQPGKQPVTYDRLVDPSVWKDAVTLSDKH
jgi:NitT/TauT family transport system substrate-binding protein